MKSIITIALIGDYPSASPTDDLVRGLRAEIEAHARISNAPPFLRGRDERVMPRDECGRLKAKSAAGGKR
jgi:hypothetical protein